MDNRNTNSQNPFPRRDDEQRGFDYSPHRSHTSGDSPYNRLTGRYNPLSEADLAAARAAREERAAQRAANARRDFDDSPFGDGGQDEASAGRRRRGGAGDVPPLADSPRYRRSQQSLDEAYERGYSSRETAASRRAAASGNDRASQRAQQARAERRQGSSRRSGLGNRIVVNADEYSSRRKAPDWYSGDSENEARRWEQNRAARERTSQRPSRDTYDGRGGAATEDGSRRTYGDDWRRERPDGQGGPSWYENVPRSRAGRDPRPAIDASQRSGRWASRGEGNAVRGRGYRATSDSSAESAGILGVVQSLLFAAFDFVRENLRLVLAVIVGLIVVILLFNGVRGCVAADDAGRAAADGKEITISFAGDCTLGSDEDYDEDTSFDAKYAEVGDPGYFFANVKDTFANDDLTIVNLEGPLTNSEDIKPGESFNFKGSPDYVNVLTAGGVDAVTLANNHSQDYGATGYQDTINALDNAGVLSFGYDRIAYTEIDGVKIAMVSGNMVDDPNDDLKQMIDAIGQAKQEGAQLIIAYPHWGIEKDEAPGGTQLQGGRQLIDAGAHIVVGSHPHVIQGYEKYDGRYIVYSMGNFCFGGNSQPEDMDTWIFQQTFTIDADGSVSTDDHINVVPCRISSDDSVNNFQPTPATGDAQQEILDKINARTALVNDLTREFNQGENTNSSGDQSEGDNA